MGVLFENSIVCHVFYAMVGDGWVWLLLWWLGLVVLDFCFWFACFPAFSSFLWGLGGGGLGLGLVFWAL
nr:hypothetical protein [Actinomyces sp.]